MEHAARPGRRSPAARARQQAEFYTALYHSLLHPNVISDDNGQYPGFNGKVQTVDSGHSAAYANYSGWDIYRSQAQLEALIDPQVASDTAQSMLDDYAQTGMLPKWSAEQRRDLRHGRRPGRRDPRRLLRLRRDRLQHSARR